MGDGWVVRKECAGLGQLVQGHPNKENTTCPRVQGLAVSLPQAQGFRHPPQEQSPISSWTLPLCAPSRGEEGGEKSVERGCRAMGQPASPSLGIRLRWVEGKLYDVVGLGRSCYTL